MQVLCSVFAWVYSTAVQYNTRGARGYGHSHRYGLMSRLHGSSSPLPAGAWAYRHALFQSVTFVAYGLPQSASKIFCSAATTTLAFVFQLAPAVW